MLSLKGFPDAVQTLSKIMLTSSTVEMELTETAWATPMASDEVSNVELRTSRMTPLLSDAPAMLIPP